MKKFAWLLMILLLAGSAGLAEGGATPELLPDAGETFFSFTLDEEEAEPEATQAETVAETTAGDTPAQREWTYPISRELLADEQDVIRLINRENLLTDDYPPEDDLHKLMDTTVKKTKNEKMVVREIVNDALIKLFEAANADGAKPLVHSAVRTYRQQAVMHENRVKRIGKDDGIVQLPGASEHQSGLAVDVINAAWAKEERLNSGFFDTTEGQWLANNAHRFGFIIRYPKEKEDITGVPYEPWHLRYVGIEVATYIHEQGLSLEEFTAEWRAALAAFEMNIDTTPVVDSFTF